MKRSTALVLPPTILGFYLLRARTDLAAGLRACAGHAHARLHVRRDGYRVGPVQDAGLGKKRGR